MPKPAGEWHGRGYRWVLTAAVALGAGLVGVAEPPQVRFQMEAQRVNVLIGDQLFARYVFQDEAIPRPYWCDVHAPNGFQVTRNHPPREGVDRTDHATYHPGVWTAFGDISGGDFWRNRARVEHDGFVAPPTDGNGTGSFTVKNVYASDDGETVCQEVCRYDVVASDLGAFLLQDSVFSSEQGPFTFGDQEEMGLGVRVATPLSVEQGGTILNSDDLRNEEEAWGKQADWCDYGGVVAGERLGVTLMPHPANFRPSWFHARDYGLLVANPFGRNAFTSGEKSAVAVEQGEQFRLRFGIFVYTVDADAEEAPAQAYRKYLELAANDQQ